MSITPERWKQIEELYSSALEQGPEERIALLAKASPEVRDIVNRMLAQETGGHILDRPAWEGETETPNQCPAEKSRAEPRPLSD